jgi:hypothetical protein
VFDTLSQNANPHPGETFADEVHGVHQGFGTKNTGEREIHIYYSVNTYTHLIPFDPEVNRG